MRKLKKCFPDEQKASLVCCIGGGVRICSNECMFAPCLIDYKLLNVIYYGNAQCARW